MSELLNVRTRQLSIVSEFALYRAQIQQHLTDGGNIVRDDGSSYIASLTTLPVTTWSMFFDHKWDYTEDENGASVNARGSSLIIDWAKYENIPEFVVTEIKTLTHLYYISPSSFKCKGRKRNKVKANTLAQVTKYGLAYLDTLFRGMNETYGEHYVRTELYSLAEVNRSLFEKAASEYPFAFSVDLKIFLDNLCHPFAECVFGTRIDIENSEAMDWKVPAGHGGGRKPQQVIPEKLFEPLVFNASLLVADFLVALCVEPEDKIARSYLGAGLHSIKLCSDYGLSKRVFDAYIAKRLLYNGYNEGFVRAQIPGIEKNTLISDGGKFVCDNTTNRRLADDTGKSVAELESILAIVKYAAQYLVAQFTGMRPGEIAEVPGQCLALDNGSLILKGRQIKGKERRFRGLFDDKWVVIPTMHDAVSALNMLGRVYQNRKLFSSIKTTAPGAPGVPLTSCSWARQVNTLLRHIFGSTNPNGLRFNAYMTRHTLAYQLFRAEVGLPFISYQLKHLVNDAERYTSRGKHGEVTVSYGSIGEQLATGIRGLRRKAEIEGVKAIMDPDGVYLGPKGKEHKDHLKKLFQGYMAQGYSKEDVIDAMVEQGIALVNVGQGFCYGGTAQDFDESIPCIGTLRCNPVRCHNAIVTKVNAPKWREIYVSNKMNLGKPEYANNVPQMLEAMEEAEKVLRNLGEEVLL